MKHTAMTIFGKIGKNTTLIVRIIIISGIVWESAGQNTPLRCSTAAVPQGFCTTLRGCPFLVTQSGSLTLNQFLFLYGGCGRDKNGDTLLCCPIQQPVITTPAVVNKPERENINSKLTDCGRRVVGEGPEWPFLAAVGRTLQGKFKLLCAGAYINELWILLDIECVNKHPVNEVIPGTIWNEKQPYQQNFIKRTLLSDRTDDGRHSKGVALIQTERPVVFNEYVQRVCLPDAGSTETPFLMFNLEIARIQLTPTDETTIFHGLHSESVRGIQGTSSTCDATSECVPSAYKAVNPLDICTTSPLLRGDGKIRTVLVEEDLSPGRYKLMGVGGENYTPCNAKANNIYASVVGHLRWIDSQISSPSIPPPIPVDNRFIPEGQACGRRSIGEGREFPFMAIIGRLQNQMFDPKCTGAILSGSWILTDAECIVDNFVTHVKIAPNTTQEMLVKIDQQIRHRFYDPVSKQANIALMKLNNPLTFNEFIEPVCFPSTLEMGSDPLFGIFFQFNPFSPEYLKLFPKTKIFNYMKSEDCKASGHPTHPLNPDSICAVSIGGCYISSNFMLLQRDPASSNFILHGIGGDSNPFLSCDTDVKAYTRVFPYRQWISDTIRGPM